jgi:hypothetical protein
VDVGGGRVVVAAAAAIARFASWTGFAATPRARARRAMQLEDFISRACRQECIVVEEVKWLGSV